MRPYCQPGRHADLVEVLSATVAHSDVRLAYWVLDVAKAVLMIYNVDVYQGGPMQVSKWGNSLAVRLPTAVVDALNLKEGDQIEIRIVRDRVFEVGRDQSTQRALARLRRLRRPLPAGFVFDREEANAR
jgi:antitoxin MazE